jgi:hypothetical protein
MRTKDKLIVFAFVAGLAVYGTLAQTQPDLKPVQGANPMATIGDGSAAAHADTGPQIIKITAAKFHFTPDRITLDKGRPVRCN